MFGMQPLAPPRFAAPVGPFQKPPLAPPPSAEPERAVRNPAARTAAIGRATRAVGNIDVGTARSDVSDARSTREPSELQHRAAEAADQRRQPEPRRLLQAAAAPANSTGIRRAILANMILVYHQNDERGNSVVDGAVAAFAGHVFNCWTTG